MTLAPGTKLGPYEILALIGAGGMGEVYRARDPRVGRDVAIKVSSEQFSDRFTREIHAVAALNHSNICTLFDVGSNYLVMEMVEGPTLADRIKQGPIPLEESLEIARQIADALEAAHEKGIVHRDLKPGNIKIRPDGTVKVLDFGLAKVEEAAAISLETSPTLSVAQTAAGVLLGTAAYMSPEQARGKPVDKRADIWSFGAVLYEMLTGRQLFTGETVSDTLAATLKEEPAFERVPAKVRLLLRSCLEKNPAHRLRDIADAWRLLETAPESTPVKSPWLAWSVAALSILIAGALAFVLFHGKPLASTEAMRLMIGMPDKVVPASNGSFALSPDGRFLAFDAFGPDGVKRLYVRALNSLEARPLPGTEYTGWASPFWSPDNRFIAFCAGGKLKKIDINGGPPLTICSLSGEVVGGSWNQHGVIIFSNYPGNKGIIRVSSEGGTASPVTRPDTGKGGMNHFLPSFLPDGSHFLYEIEIPENRGIYVGSLDLKPEEQEYKRILSATSGPLYLPPRESGPGHVLFLRNQTLMTQSFDPERLRAMGDPIPVAENVRYYLNYGCFSASANGTLVYASGSSLLAQPTWYDRQGRPTGVAGEPGLYFGMAISPNGQRAALSLPDSSQSSIYSDLQLWDVAREINTRFTFGQGFNISPVWSPDGNRVVFSAGQSGHVSNLYQKSASGAEDETLLLKSDKDDHPTSFSRDGRFVLYNRLDPKTNFDLWVLPLTGDRKARAFLVTNFNENDAHFSPDVHWVAYVSDESGTNEVYVRRFSQTSIQTQTEAAEKWKISSGGGIGPRWRENGKELYYLAPDGNVMAVAITADTGLHAGVPKALFHTPVFSSAAFTVNDAISNWDAASDGNRFLLAVPARGASLSPFNVILNWTSLLKK